MSATVPQPDPNAEMRQFFEQQQQPTAPADPVPSVAATAEPTTGGDQPAAPPPPVTDHWAEIADDEDLPASLKGKTRREVWDALKPAASLQHKAGYEKNEALAQLDVQKRLNEKLWGEMERIRTAVQPQTAPQQGYEQMGITDPQQLFNDPRPVLNAIPKYVQDQLGQATQQFQQQVGRMSGEMLALRSDMAQTKARENLKLDEETFTAIRPWLASVMMNNQADPTIPKNWEMAVDLYKKHAAKLFPVAQNVTATPSVAGNGRPSAVASAPAAKKNTTGDPRLDRALQPQLDVWNKSRASQGLPLYTLAEFKDYVYSEEES